MISTSTTPAPLLSPPSSDSDSDSSSHRHHHSDLSSTIFKSYLELSGDHHNQKHDLIKIQAFLTSSRSGALSCLICLERIRPSDPTWSCSSRCFAVFHLHCIQSWGVQSSNLAAVRAITRAATPNDSSLLWHCPKCRVEYSKSQIPKTYYCFCGKLPDPPHDPWVLPHSCGEICGRPLMYNCGHNCLLLCHPGPCPSCPKLVTSKCFCGAVEDVKRCGFKNFSCNGVCKKMLDCNTHRCNEICHADDCPPCKAKGMFNCQCGKVEMKRECFDRVFRCENPCEKLLGCGRHKCEKGCHEGDCGDCPLQGKRTCPCGKIFYEGIACDVMVSVCGATCGKMLSCGFHRCPERCHRGPCVETCRLVVTKSCRCGSYKKQCHGPRPPPLPEFTLKSKKKRPNNQIEPTPGSPCPPCPQLVWRSCLGNHVGAERMVCSDRATFSCDNLCGNPLACGNHYCTNVCHTLVTSTSKLDSSSRAETCEKCTLPCQQERRPTCPHPCPLSCHPGECPPCKALIKRSCHCGSMVHVFECIYYNSLSAKEQLTVRSCGGPCHRKLPNCTHLCPETCHPGECPSPDQCSKKVNVRCGCQSFKKELLCKDVQAAYRSSGTDPKDVSRNQYGLGLLPCNSDCRSKMKASEAELQHRKSKAPEEKEPETKDNATKRRRRRVRVLEDEKTSTLQQSIVAGIRRFLLFVITIIALIASVYLGYKGLQWLSERMNEAEIQRQRRYART
uniref:RING-type domain-containing protein n=1 Tax=Solanum lycopersicum TaxID=4081 RepID=Q5GA66_SOLLC|nr:unknown [Solanum lycopersicum]